MSKKGQKRIRKYLRNELKGLARVEARLRVPWRWLPWKKSYWFEIKRFPRYQVKFTYRFIREVEMNDGNKLNISN